MLTSLLFALPLTILSILLFFVLSDVIQKKVNNSLLSGKLHKNSRKIKKIYGLGFYVFLLSSLLPSIVYLIFFKIEINFLLLGELVILTSILKISVDNNNKFITILINLLIASVVIKLLNYSTETTIDFIVIALVFLLILSYSLINSFISETKLLYINSIITLLICVFGFTIDNQVLFFINLSIFTSSICLLVSNKLNKKHKILITTGGKLIIGTFLITLASFVIKLFL
tara:strand:+ start:301 stop:987 length:687 start_codon:yes stop_codon:yes gene_type:complete